MVKKTLNEIIQDLIIHIHDTLIDVDTKQGTFIRDVFINPVSEEFASVYNELGLMEIKQSILTATGEDLDRLAQNYFVERKISTKSSGKLRFYINPYYIDNDSLLTEISLPKGTTVSTLSTVIKDSISAQTTETIYLNRLGILSLPINEQGLRYIEVSAESIETGTDTNVGSNEFTQQLNNKSQFVLGVNNPYSFTGGTDQEDDNSLMIRVGLVISGSNIGTKNGYLSYILKQNGVLDALIVGAGDSIMFRDGGYVNNANKYIPGRGGMVDIYIKGKISEERTLNFSVTNSYVNGDNPYSDIILSQQPGLNTVSIISSSGYQFINGTDYQIEKGAYIDNSGNLLEDIRYYKDILWDFSIKDNFPDVLYYPILVDLDDIPSLKVLIDNELQDVMKYMSNINYGLNWSLMSTQNNNTTDLFVKYSYNNEIFKIVSNDLNINGAKLSGRTFVKKDDKIYVRIYRQPDYTLTKDLLPSGGSIRAKDRIRWLSGIKPNENEQLTITYNYNKLIGDLQDGIENYRILTADVLIKEATELPLEIIISANCFSSYNSSTIKRNIINKVTDYINNIKKMGGTFDSSDIISLVHSIDGVDSVDIDKLKISKLGYSPVKSITAMSNEYFSLGNLLVTVYQNT